MEKTVNDISVEGCTREQKKGYLIPSRPIPLKSRVTKGFLIRFRLLAAEEPSRVCSIGFITLFRNYPASYYAGSLATNIDRHSARGKLVESRIVQRSPFPYQY